eukprot:gene68314-93618_t
MGADRGILIQSDVDVEPLAVAKLLAAVAKEEGVDVVLMGKQAIDGDNNAVGQMLSQLLGWPQASFASKVEIAGGKSVINKVTGKNIFSNPDGSPSKEFYWYIGGLQKYTPAAMALFAPYVN